ncbi:MAG: response regulator [Dysgonamonadaceae bacterium]|nr:response regulator [Dysgonamonadaceae bacterium]
MRFGLLIFALLPVLSLAQPEFDIRKLGIEQGLSNNYVVDIAQDRQGFMWFATESGLNRFDGNRFWTYRKFSQTAASISGNELNKVFADPRENAVWIATQRNGLNRFDCETETFTLFAHDDRDSNSIASDAVTDICESADGNLWLATYSNGIDLYDRKKFIHFNRSTLPGLPSDKIWSILDDKKGKLYVGHVDKGLTVINLNDNSVKNYQNSPGNPNSLPDNCIWDIFIDNMGGVWLGTANGLSLFNPDNEHFTSFRHNPQKPSSLISDRIFSINQAGDNRLWIGSENGGISILNLGKDMFLSPEAVEFQNIYPSDDETGLSCATVKKIITDRFGNIWIGTYSGGLNFISRSPEFFRKWQYQNTLNNNSLPVKTAWGICTDNEGAIWVGTDGGGVCKFVNGLKTATYNVKNGPMSGDATLSAFKDSEGNLWFGAFMRGITLYNSKTGRFSAFMPAVFGNLTIRCFYEDEKKNLWIGTDDAGLYAYNLNSGKLSNYTAESHRLPTDNLVRAVAKDARGRLWVGSFGMGLVVLDADYRRITAFHKDSGFYSNAVSSIFLDSKQQIWVGTGEGLVCFQNPDSLAKFRIYTEKDGLRDSYIRAIVEDRAGNIWFSHNGGISKFDEKSGSFSNYDHSQGLPVGQFMDGSVTVDGDGRLYFGSQNGVCFFNPQNGAEIGDFPPVEITEFRYFSGKQASEDREAFCPVSLGKIRLKYNQNTLTFRFGVMDYAFSGRAEYSCRLEGLSDEWYFNGKSGESTFRNLPAGTYIFSVKARLDNNSEWSPQIASFKVRVLPPLWWSWWAKMIYLWLISLLIYYVVMFYIRRLQFRNILYLEKQNSIQQQALNNEKLQFFTNITHELRTPLTLIIGPLEDLLADKMPDEAGRKISLIHQNAKRLLDLINKILDFRKTETKNMPLKVRKGNLADFVSKIGEKYSELNQNPDIKIVTTIETENPVLYFDPENLAIILDNLISNALKYTDRGEIRIALRDVRDGETLYSEIEVADEGCGIEEDELAKIFDRYYQAQGKRMAQGTGIGLALAKNLAELHQGAITAESKPSKGSTFRLRIKTENIYPDIERREDDGENLPENQENIQPETDAKADRKIILIVEDNREILQYAADAFKSDFKVLKAENGQKGLVAAQQQIPDIIISDIMMPEMSGIELCEILKKNLRTCHIPIILLTAKTSMSEKAEGYASGADSYITKPFSAALLRSRVANLLESRKNLAKHLVNSKLYKQELLVESINILDNEFIEKVSRVIRDYNLPESIDIEFIASQVAMTHSTLYRKIKAITGLTVNEFVRRIKMKQAEELLLSGRYSISEVAYRTGFNSAAYFRKCFRDEFGATPAEYLRKLH